MPYVRREPRALVDPYIDEIIWRVRNEYPVAAIGEPLRFIAACLVVGVNHQIAFTMIKHAYLSDPVKNLVALITEQFVDIEQRGVINYCLSRIIAGSFIPHVPCTPQQWPYVRCDDVLDVFANAEEDAISICFQMGKPTTGLRGVFRAAAAEFYRRVVAPKEDTAILANGDIREYELPTYDYCAGK